MDCATAEVLEVRGRTAMVRARPAAPCASCAGAGGCGELRLSEARGGRPQTLEVDNPVGAGVGDTVAIELPARGVLAIAVLLYLFPTVAAIGGALLGRGLGPALLGVSPDVGSVLFLAALLGASFGTLAAVHPRLAARRSLRVTITDVLARAGSGESQRV